MTTKVEKTIQVSVPVSTAYNQWTQFEDFPQFMGGVQEVRQLDDDRLHWVAQIGGVKREWEARILEQVTDEKVAWAATEGATNAGAVYFTPVGANETSVRLCLEYEPEGVVEKAADKLNIVGKRAEADLEKFKKFIESRGVETGGWRGSVNEGAAVGTPGVENAAASQGDSGSSGISKTAVAGVAAVAAAGVAAAAAMKSGSDSSEDSDAQPGIPDVETVTYTTTATAGAVDAPLVSDMSTDVAGGLAPSAGVDAAPMTGLGDSFPTQPDLGTPEDAIDDPDRQNRTI